MLVLSAAFMVWMERKVCAYIQQRTARTASASQGLLQPFADVIKLLFKEELRPKAADALLFALAPVISAAAAFAAFAVVPFGTETTFFGLLDQPMPLQVTDVNVAVLVVFAITSMGIYGIVLAGWSSNSKYSLLGGLRSSAQMISYELSYGLALAAVVMLASSLSLREIVVNQSGTWFGVIPRWYADPAVRRVPDLHDRRHRRDQPRAVRLPGSGAGAGRRLPHRVQLDELRACSSSPNTSTWSRSRRWRPSLYLGGWLGPFLPDWLAWMWFLLKVFLLLFFYIWMRWTLPRYRYDQLMEFGWKYLLPVAVLNLLATAAGVVLG